MLQTMFQEKLNDLVMLSLKNNITKTIDFEIISLDRGAPQTILIGPHTS